MFQARTLIKIIFTLNLIGSTCRLFSQSIPAREWSTYVGANRSDYFRDLVVDRLGNIYSIGTSESNGIATDGTHQLNPFGGSDVLITKFDSKGRRLWATYFGGTNDETGQSIALDSKGNIFVAGNTKSTSNIATPGAHQFDFGGNPEDGFLAKFSEQGSLIWSTYIGGNDEDAVNAVTIDNNDNIIICGWTLSNNQIATPNSQQDAYRDKSDAFMNKFDNNGARIWGTYLGDIGFDLGLQVSVDAQNFIVMSGWTSSQNNFGTPNAFQTLYAGGTSDAFLAKYSSTGTLIWCTYLGGPSEEYGDAMVIDHQNNIYIGGPGNSSNGLSTIGTHQSIIGGNFDAYLNKFDASGNRMWGTYLGGRNNEGGYGLAVDLKDFVYLTGYTDSDDGISTNNAYQINRSAENDVFVEKFTSSGQRVWGTYYGDRNIDGSLAVTVDHQYKVIIAGFTASQANIASPGAYQPFYGGGFNDGLLVSFAPCVEPEASILGRTVCTNDPIFDTIKPIGVPPYNLYMTLDGKKSQIVTSLDSLIILQLFGTQWNDSVRIDSIKSLDCKGVLKGNTLYKTEKTLSYTPLDISCNQNNSTYTISFTTNVSDVSLVGSPQFLVLGNRVESIALPNNQIYNVKFVHPAGCDTIFLSGGSGCVSVCPPSNSNIATLNPACVGDIVQISAQGKGNYFWSGSAGFTSTVQNPILAINSINQAGRYQLVTSDSLGCIDTLYTNLLVRPRPVILASSNSPQCIKGTLQLNSSPASSYLWKGPNNFSSTLQNPTINNLRQISSGRYHISIADLNGCKNSDSMNIVIDSISKTIISGKDSICQNEFTTLNASGGGNFFWDNGQNTPSITLSPKQSTSFKVIRAEGSCMDTAQIFIRIKPLPSVMISGPTSLTKGNSIQLKASGAKTYSWFPSSGLSCTSCDQPMANPSQDIAYCVTGNEIGCTDTACVQVIVKPICKLFIPNIFTPNHDNTNDEWCLSSDCYQINSIQIFNRWGTLVWHSNGNNPCWDGMDMNKQILSGVYVYLVDAIDDKGIKIIHKGDLTVTK